MLILPICPQNMALLQQKLGFSYLLILCLATLVSSHRPYTTPSVTRLTDSFPRVQVDSAFSKVVPKNICQINAISEVMFLFISSFSLYKI